MELIHAIGNALANVPNDVWTLLAEIVGSALVVSPVVLHIKKLLGIDDPRRREKIMTVVVIFASIAASSLVYLRTVPKFAPWFVLVQGILTYAATQPVYFFFVKPVAVRIGAWFTTRIQAALVVTEAKSAAVPAEGLPIGGTPAPVDDFSH